MCNTVFLILLTLMSMSPRFVNPLGLYITSRLLGARVMNNVRFQYQRVTSVPFRSPSRKLSVRVEDRSNRKSDKKNRKHKYWLIRSHSGTDALKMPVYFSEPPSSVSSSGYTDDNDNISNNIVSKTFSCDHGNQNNRSLDRRSLIVYDDYELAEKARFHLCEVDGNVFEIEEADLKDIVNKCRVSAIDVAIVTRDACTRLDLSLDESDDFTVMMLEKAFRT